MRTTFWTRLGVLLGCVAVSAVGCNRSVVRDKQVPDPLVMTKRPVEGKSHMTAGHKTAWSDVPAPPRPEPATITTVSNPPDARLMGLKPLRQGEH
jgi:hypothetical protein